MAVPSPSSLDTSTIVSLKNSSSTPSSVVPKVSDSAGDHAPAPTANGITEQQPGAQDIAHTELDDNTVIQNSDSATATTASIGQVPVSSLPVGTTESAAPAPPLPGPSPLEARESFHESRKDKNGDKPGASTSKNISSPSNQGAPAASVKANGASKHKSTKTSRTSKLPFFSKLLRILVPCVSSSPGAHPIEVEKEPPTASTSREKRSSVSTERVGQKSAAPTAPVTDVTLPQPVTAEPVSLTPAKPVPDTPPPVGDEVLIPATPPAPQLRPLEETEGVTSGAVQPPGSTGGGSLIVEEKRHSRDSTPPSHVSAEEESEGTSFTEDEDIDGLDELEDDEDKLIMNGGAGIPIGPDGIPKPLLPPIAPQHTGRKCLILDLDETLVHSSFKSIQQADYVVPVEIEYHWHNVYVIKRPGVDNFLKKMGEMYEIVVFTASLSKYADPVLDKLDVHQVVSHRLFRESCYNHKGNYVKDLSQLGRPIANTIILDNSPASYIFHPNNAVPVSSWFNDPHDTELTDLVPFLADLAIIDDVRGVLDGAR